MEISTRNREYDVVIVGASVAGCTAALLYARAGLSVAVIDRKKNSQSYKSICTTYIQKSAYPVIHKLGIEKHLLDNNATPNRCDLWTRYGWIEGENDVKNIAHGEHGYCVRRSDLDPLLTEQVATQPGIDLMLGTVVQSLVMEDEEVKGIGCQSAADGEFTLRARLVVGADGRYSTVAKLLDVPTKTVTNDRSAHYAFYENIDLESDGKSLFWLLEPDAFFAYPYSGGQTLMCCFISREKSASWKNDLEGNFDSMMHSLPNSPGFDGAARVSEFVSMKKMDNKRRPAAYKSCALIGDAALSADPLSGVGCGWAFQSADLLVEHTLEPIRQGLKLNKSLSTYRKHHKKMFWMHDMFISKSSESRNLNLSEKMLAIAATSNTKIGHDFHEFISRSISPTKMFNLENIGLIFWVYIKHQFKRDTSSKSLDLA